MVSPEGDSTFFEFPKTQASGVGPPEPPKANTHLASIPSPRLNFNFRGNIAANQSCLTINALAIPSPQNTLPKHTEKNPS